MASTTSITEESLKTALTERLKATHVEVTDMSGGCGQSFTSLIVSPLFAGQSSLKRHRAVNAALRDEIAAIHAWSAKCQTPEEWEKARAPSTQEGSGEPHPPLDGTVGGKVDGVNA
ncbi:bola domain-containing protein [Xylaria bambusicola]|uniref:bola domain-containing protein n=1 Tax=Xylaria bambusicola TaxID=326684 RepID=UPI00200730A7|nr:bola domain-containing protein [Xylaria bambusicola]KAI0506353.1 bola domain-containing protein [Xylaria bambusicola]